MDNSVINTLASGLDYGSARLQAISNNLSNVNTPGYKRKDVSFDALLKSAADDADLPSSRTDPRHLSPRHGDPNHPVHRHRGRRRHARGRQQRGH